MNIEIHAADNKKYLAILIAAGVLSEIAYLLFYVWPFPLLTHYATPLMDLGKLAHYGRAEGTAFVLSMALLFVLYITAYWAIRRISDHKPLLFVALGFTALFGVTLVFVYPLGGLDIFGYIFQGRALAHYNANPFVVAPIDFQQDPLFPYLAWVHEPSNYGPLWLLISGAAALLYTGSMLGGLFAFKGISLLFVLLSAWLVYLLAKGRSAAPVSAALLFAWNPLVLYETAVNGHNDIVMAFLALAAVYMLISKRVNPALPLLMASVMVKFITLILLPVLAYFWLRDGKSWWRQLTKASWGIVLAAALAVALYAPFWEGTGTIGALSRGDLFTASPPALAFYLLEHIGVPAAAQVVRMDVLIVFGAFVVWRVLTLRNETDDLLSACFDIVLVYFFVATLWFQPWYLILLLAFTATVNHPFRRRLGVLFSASAILNYFVFCFLWFWYPGQLGMLQIQAVAVLAIFGAPFVYLITHGIRVLHRSLTSGADDDKVDPSLNSG